MTDFGTRDRILLIDRGDIMTDALTARQTQILKALIDEYIESAEPVGSESLDKKYTLGVSPATIRSEMFQLVRLGYLKQPHTSSGRVPTPKAMKFYVSQLMEEKQMSVTDEVKTKEEVWDKRGDLDDLMNEATQVLADKTQSLAVGTVDQGKVWHSGSANVFRYPEFFDPGASFQLFTLLEEFERMQDLFFHGMNGVNPVEIIFGEDMGWSDLPYLGVVGTRFRVQGHDCALGVVGTTRQRYPTVVPVIRYFRGLIEEIAR